MSRKLGQLFLSICIAISVCIVANSVRADARTEYLINMLENGANYRIRVQAAATLGKLRSKEALPALVRALKDENELVVISVVIALGQIGDFSVVSDIEKVYKNPPSAAARSQTETTLRILKALSPNAEKPDQVGAKPRFLIRVDAMGNSSGVKRQDMVETLREVVFQRLGKDPSVVLQKPGMTNQQVRNRLKKDKLAGYILSGSIIKMDHVGNQIVVKVGLNVFTNPEYNLLMMPTAQAIVSMRHGSATEEKERSVERRAIKSVADTLLGSIFEKLGQMVAP